MKDILWAPAAYWTLHPNDKKEICNRCGPRGVFADYIPNKILGLYIGECCNIHDYMYNKARPNIEDKKKADRVFKNNMLRLIDAKTKWKWLRKMRKWLAEKYYKTVKLFGGPAFWRGKNNTLNMGDCK